MAENPALPGAPGEAPGQEFHAVADLFPLLRGAAFEQLVADIRKNGLREPILLDAEGRIIDGRNRYRACLAAGVEPRFVEWQGEGSVTELALSLNLRRRHLDESQRALVAARLAKLMEKEAVKRKGRRLQNPADLQGSSSGESRMKAAALVNVSPRLISYAIKVLREGCNELIAAVESGAVAVSPAGVLAGLPEEEQKKVVAGGAKEAARKVRELRAGKSRAERPRAAPSPHPSLGYFGVIGRAADSDGVVLLWVDAGGLDDTIDALKAWGFRYAPPAS
ncbi:MAG: ParB N-terminal domain-containing protein [Acidobacteria bacterium]|nr:ParB N-terminal domain-containing protein [Acidobacteriota bacterium]